MPRRIVQALLAVGALAATALGQPAKAADHVRTVNWNELTDRDYGQVLTVCGPVSYAAGPSPTGILPTLGSLVLGGAPIEDPRQVMTSTERFKIVIQDYNETFPKDPAAHYGGKEICAVGRIVSALVGGFEIIPTHVSQIAIRGEGRPSLPRGEVRKLPAGAVSYKDAKAHIGRVATVCGVVVSGRADMTPAGQFPSGYQLPQNVRERLGPDFQLSTDARRMHEIYLGDRTMVIVDILASSAAGLPEPPMQYYVGKEVCAKGRLQPSIMEGAYMVVENSDVTRLN